jgi:hypothetical protein
MSASSFEPRHWFLVADRTYTHDLAERDSWILNWSSAPTMKRGDIAVLYERGRRDFADQPPGRKEIGWVLRALSEPASDRRWGNVTWFRAEALHFPVPLAKAKSSRSVRNWGAMRASLQGSNGTFEMPSRVWRGLRNEVEEYNPGIAGTLDGWERSRPRKFTHEPLPESSYEDDVLEWRSEEAMQPVVLDLIDCEGWAHRIDPDDKRFGRPSSRGFHLPREDWYVDYVLWLGTRRSNHALVVEFERVAHGDDPEHGARQASDYCRALRGHLRDCDVSGLVVAQDFNEAELQIAEELHIECMLLSRDKKRRRSKLSEAGGYRGAVHAARRRRKAA